MLSKAIISSAAFIKMPSSTQMLYFHLVLNADDDGVVEAFPVIRMVGAAEDDLKILVAKNFVIVLNEDLVSYINDWKEHNLIRPDRKIDSKYKGLLLKIGIEIRERKPRIDTKEGLKQRALEKIDINQIDISKNDTYGPSSDSEMSAQDRIGEVRIDRDTISNTECINVVANKKSRSSAKKVENYDFEIRNCPYETIIELYNQILGSNGCPKSRVVADSTNKMIKSRWLADLKTIEKWQEYFEIVYSCDFLIGQSHGKDRKPFFATLEWLVKPANYAKVMNGNYYSEE
jgi:hypothetical protein